MRPRISIITPVHNGAAFLAEVIASVLAQTEDGWEWLIVNDGSTDGTAEILDALDDPRCIVIHQANAGVGAARNAALDRATGEYVTFLDADDLLPPDALRVRTAFLDQRPEIDIVNGAVRITSEGKEVRRYTPSRVEGPLLPRLARLEEGVFIGVPYMLRRERIGTQRFPVGATQCEDLIFFLTLAHDTGLTYGATPDVTYEYRLQPGSAMSNLDGIERGYRTLLAHAAKLPRLDRATLRYMRRRVTSIMVKSWLRRGNAGRAVMSLEILIGKLTRKKVVTERSGQ